MTYYSLVSYRKIIENKNCENSDFRDFCRFSAIFLVFPNFEENF